MKTTILGAILVGFLSTAQLARAQQITARLEVSTEEPLAGESFEVEVVVDMGEDLERLGAYEARLVWDEGVLELVEVLDGSTPGFAGAQTRLAAGELLFSTFDPQGAEGTASLLRLRFRAVGQSGQSSPLELSFGVLDAAGSFADLRPLLQVQSTAVQIAEGPVNQPPSLAEIGDRTVGEGDMLILKLSAADPDGDAVHFSAANGPAGSILSDSTFTWVPDFDQAGAYQVTFTADDGRGGIASATATITVADGPAPPGPISMDFDLVEGDQEQRRAGSAIPGAVYEIQLNVADAPLVSGWSALIDYDPEQVRYVSGSFQSSDFIPGLVALVDEDEGQVGVGGTVLGTDVANSGNGTLGTLSFEILEGFADSTELAVAEVRFHRADGTDDRLVVHSAAAITSQPEIAALPGDFDGSGGVDFGDFFIFADAFGGADPRFDLDGSGGVDFGDFFIFADSFGEEARGKLLALARERLGLPAGAGLQENYPNPFNHSTTIRYRLAKAGTVRLEIFDLAGQKVRTLVRDWQTPGSYRFTWNGTDEEGKQVATGLFLCLLRAGSITDVQKMSFVK